MYQQYTCQQLAQEAQAVSARAGALSGAQDSQRTKDGVATAAAMVMFWPAAFFVGGDKQTAAAAVCRWHPLPPEMFRNAATLSFCSKSSPDIRVIRA
jgi:hypothetical protein